MSRKRITNEEWSKILGEHDAGQLIRSGMRCWTFLGERPSACINQVRFNTPDPGPAFSQDSRAAEWFDTNYNGDWFPEVFLERARKAGL